MLSKVYAKLAFYVCLRVKPDIQKLHKPRIHLLFDPATPAPNPASAAALLKQELAATSAAGAFDADSSGSDVFCVHQTP